MLKIEEGKTEIKQLVKKEKNIDFALLKKGSTVSVELIERWSGYKVGSVDYSLSVLKLRGLIEDYFSRKGNPVNTASRKGMIYVLTDTEGSRTAANRGKCHLQGVRRSLEQLSRTDVSNLTEREKLEHLRSVEVLGSYVSAIDAVTRGLPSDDRPSWMMPGA